MIEPGTRAFNEAVDAHITGNYGADYERGSTATEDEFYDLAERTLTKELKTVARTLIIGEEAWEMVMQDGRLDETAATKAYTGMRFPETERDREMVVQLEKAVTEVAKLLEFIPFDDHKVTELARELTDGYWERKDRGY